MLQRKAMTVAVTPNPPPPKKILWVPNIGPEIRKEFRKVTKDHCKDITFTSGKNSQKMSKSTEATT